MAVSMLLLAAAAAAVAVAVAAAAAASPPPPPTHILLMLIDDLGFADVGYHGAAVGSRMVTPTIDKLSAEGVRLEQYYVTFLCSPTRTSLLSGRYPYTIGMNSEVIVDGAASCMPNSVATIGDRLSAAGWATSAYGKWDAGMTTWGCTPTCRGFQHFFGVS
jgi:arylsulfatase A-like enzyme